MSCSRLYNRIRDVYRVDTSSEYRNVMARMDLDSRADTSVLGSSFKVLEDTEQTCTVAPFLDSYTPTKDVPIVSGGTAYTDPAKTVLVSPVQKAVY